jgi:hypothetical protein
VLALSGGLDLTTDGHGAYQEEHRHDDQADASYLYHVHAADDGINVLGGAQEGQDEAHHQGQYRRQAHQRLLASTVGGGRVTLDAALAGQRHGRS